MIFFNFILLFEYEIWISSQFYIYSSVQTPQTQMD